MIQKLFRRALPVVARIGVAAQDSDEVRLQKSLLALGSLMFIAAGVAWGILYFLFGHPLAGFIPLSYAIISFLSVILFHLTRRFSLFLFSQLLLILLLPFLLMIALGGFIHSSAVILLADSPEGTKLEMEASGSRDSAQRPFGVNRDFTTKVVTTTGDIKRGFVYKRVPHVTLKSIANNEEIDAIHAKWQEQLDPLRAKINRVAKQKWEEWEIPRTLTPRREEQAASSTLSRDAGEGEKLLEEWWQARRDRQKEIDASIAKRADTELLYDQPYEDNKRIRVTGPFTVESLSPHRVLAADEQRPASEAAGQQATAGQFTTLIIDNLKKAGVQNTVKKERLKFDQLEPYAGLQLHAAGEYTDTDGKSRRVAVSIGPQYGTVSRDQIKEAAKEAVQGIGFDLLIVCGFAFDPQVAEEVKRYGKLTVLIAHMNPDLSMGDELLKKTGAGNLFMVFGEPDLKVKPDKDGKLTVEIKGVDVYDPTTGAIRSSSTDDIACWFIDTDYNGESFFVRHAYFTGEGDPYDRLKRALRAEIDEAAWSALYSTKSYPFDKPTSGKIAVKVINHYGDEVLKVYEVGLG